MDWYSTVFEVIDMRSFSNLWFWIVLAVVWSSASHWVLGVPFDMVARARRLQDRAVEMTEAATEHSPELDEAQSRAIQANQDLEDLVRINTNRFLFIVDEAGLWIVGLGAAFLTGLCLLGFAYEVEMAQALFLLALPMTLVGCLSVSSARKVQAGEHSGPALWRRMRIHRTLTQVIGMVSIFFTALWGMYQNLSAGVL